MQPKRVSRRWRTLKVVKSHWEIPCWVPLTPVRAIMRWGRNHWGTSISPTCGMFGIRFLETSFNLRSSLFPSHFQTLFSGRDISFQNERNERSSWHWRWRTPCADWLLPNSRLEKAIDRKHLLTTTPNGHIWLAKDSVSSTGSNFRVKVIWLYSK